MMKTLQETAIITVLKFGIRYKEIVPTLLQNEIDTVEHMIRRKLTGSNYYEYHRVIECLEFDISWNKGTWTFVQRGLFEEDEYDQRMLHIQAGKETLLSWVWGSVFGLDSLVLEFRTSFIVTDYHLEPSASRVEFIGYFYCPESGKRRTFKSTFEFSATSFYVRVMADAKFVTKQSTGAAGGQTQILIINQ